jgi:2-dehydropantoate 2-reductase
LEIEALMGAVLEIAKLTDTPAPTIETVYGLMKLLDQNRRKPRISRDYRFLKP